MSTLEQVGDFCWYFILVDTIFVLSVTNVMLNCLFTDIYFVNIVQFDLFYGLN